MPVDPLEGRVAGELGHAVEQGASVRVARPGKYLHRGTALDDRPQRRPTATAITSPFAHTLDIAIFRSNAFCGMVTMREVNATVPINFVFSPLLPIWAYWRQRTIVRKAGKQ